MTRRYHFTLIREVLRKISVSSVRVDVGKLEPSFIKDGIVKW